MRRDPLSPGSTWTRRILRLLARLVPEAEREDWVREWEAELWRDAEGRGGGAAWRWLPGRVLSAAEDALRYGLRRSGRTLLAALPELRVTARSLMRSPLFTVAVVATLGLGVGANAAMFTVVDAVLLEALPYADAERLVAVHTVWDDGGRTDFVSTADFDDLAERLRTVNGLALRVPSEVTYQTDEPIRLQIAGVSSAFFHLFGTTPHLGRYLMAEEDEPGSSSVVLSHGLWQRIFGGDPAIVGSTLTLDRQPYVVVGVAERGFQDPVSDAELWTSRPSWIEVAARDQPWLQTFGLLAPDVTLQEARAELSTVSASLASEYPTTNTGHSLTAVSVHEERAAPVRPALLVLAAVVGVLLLVTCANVAGLVLVRAAGREREMALRASLGAGRGRLLVQLVVEGLLLAVVGGAVGLGVAAGAARALAAVDLSALPRLADLTVDGTVLLFTLGVSGLTGIALGLTPLLVVSRRDLSAVLREGGGGGTGGRVRRVRRALVGAELAASAVLLVGAGLLVRSLVNLARVETGVEVEGVAVLQVSPPYAVRRDPSARTQLRSLYGEVRQRLSRLPDVQHAGGVTMPPFTSSRIYEMTRPDRPAPGPGEETLFQLRSIEPGYFRALGIPLTRGRLLDDGDGGDAPPVAVIDEEMADRVFPGEDPIGRPIDVHWTAEVPTVSYEVVGVVGNVRHLGPASSPPPTAYVPRAHETIPYWENFGLWLTVKTTGDPLTMARQAAEVVWDVDRTVPATRLGTLEELLLRHSTGTRHQALLMGTFAILATLLALVGIVGVVSYAVTQRGPELGVRQALGAGSREIVRLVMVESVRLVLVGIGSGLVLAALGARLLPTLLVGVEAAHPSTYVMVGAGLAAVALAAAWIPARRAARVRPSTALRGGA